MGCESVWHARHVTRVTGPGARCTTFCATDPKPFIWTKSARDILQKVIRANTHLSSKQNGTLH